MRAPGCGRVHGRGSVGAETHPVHIGRPVGVGAEHEHDGLVGQSRDHVVRVDQLPLHGGPCANGAEGSG